MKVPGHQENWKLDVWNFSDVNDFTEAVLLSLILKKRDAIVWSIDSVFEFETINVAEWGRVYLIVYG